MSPDDILTLTGRVVGVIQRTRVDLACEDAAQEDLARALYREFYGPRTIGHLVDREVSLSPRERIDIMVGPVGVEVKRATAQRRAVLRQLERYAAHDSVKALVARYLKGGSS
jgi:hypothetical protein